MSKYFLTELTRKLQLRENLDSSEARAAAFALAAPEPEALEKRDFLVALAQKGECPEEVSAFAETFRELAVDPGVDAFRDGAIDVCGTGGDRSGSFNLSTATAMILAAAGVPVFKHGNRSITSGCS
jgi:anthranilate phosphoribosyltransferase